MDLELISQFGRDKLRNIVHIGDHLHTRHPAIHFQPNKDWAIQIRSSTCRNESDSESFSPIYNIETGWKTGEKHKLQIVTFHKDDEDRMEVFIDNKKVGTHQLTKHCRSERTVPIYTSNPFEEPADVNISNLTYADNWICFILIRF